MKLGIDCLPRLGSPKPKLGYPGQHASYLWVGEGFPLELSGV